MPLSLGKGRELKVAIGDEIITKELTHWPASCRKLVEPNLQASILLKIGMRSKPFRLVKCTRNTYHNN